MEERDSLDVPECPLVEIGGVRENECITSDAAHVSTGLCVVGVDSAQQRFEHGGGDHTLTAFNGKTGGLDILFTDETSGVTTYAANRSLNADVAADGAVTLDFNRATNLPCAFTEFATCQLPRSQNRLNIHIKAGELRPDLD